jgi:hypothetical protein
MHATNRKLLLLLVAFVETATGLCLLFLPAVLFSILLGLEHAAVDTIFVGRIAGAALLAIGIESWMARSDVESPAQFGLFTGIFIYNSAASMLGSLEYERCSALARSCTPCNSCSLAFQLCACGWRCWRLPCAEGLRMCQLPWPLPDSRNAANSRRATLGYRVGGPATGLAGRRHRSASSADHARAERWHWHVIWPGVRAHDRPVVALPAAHVEPPHAVGAHVADGHWRPGLRSWSFAHGGRSSAARRAGEGPRTA